MSHTKELEVKSSTRLSSPNSHSDTTINPTQLYTELHTSTSSHLITIINKIKPNNNLHENRAPSTRKPINENNVSTHVDTNTFTGTRYSLDLDNKQCYRWNPKISPRGSLLSSSNSAGWV